ARYDELKLDGDPDTPRAHILEIVGRVEDRCLELSWFYSEHLHRESTVQLLAERMVDALREIIVHCAQPSAGGRTPSDFPLARLDQAAVDRLVGDGRAVEDIYPLTPMQAGMVFHSLVDGVSGAYFNQVELQLSGVADPSAFGAAWQQVVDRTPILRSRVVWEGVAEPVQVVQREVRLPITYLDWSRLPEAERQEELRLLLARDRAEGLDLTAAPLMRLVIAALPGDEIALVWTFHHLLLDGWSVPQVFAEVCQRYAAIVHGREPAPVTRRPFRDYLQWLAARDQDEAERYWRQVLAGVESTTPLPFDRQPVEAHRTESGARVRMALPAEQSDQLREAARRSGLTMNTVVQGAWALLLARYSGQRDVVFGTTVSGRPADLPGVESIVGMFVNTLPTRAHADGSQRLVSWLRDLQVQQAESRRFGHVSLAQLQTWTDLPGGANLFDSIVVFENYPFDSTAITAHGLGIRQLNDLEPTNYPLTAMVEPGESLSIALDYDPLLFDQATIERLAEYLRALLAAIAADPERPLADLPMMTDAERSRVLVEFNDTDLDVPAVTFPQAFEAQVRRTPDASALVCGATALTYAELDARANRLAHHLIASGVGPERVVALALPRSAELIVAILAVLKAGGVYLPIDREQPAERIGFVLRDAGAALVVTTADSGNVRGAAGGMPVLLLDDADTRALTAAGPDTTPTDTDRIAPLGPDSAAYIIYTSGSTGQPKGVVVEHRSLVNLLFNHRHGIGVAAGDERLRVALTASLSFDASWDPLVMMANGHELHLIEDAVRLDPPALVGYVNARHVDYLEITPTYLQQLLPAGLLDSGPYRPRILALGGEAVRDPLWSELVAVEGTATYNFYGPTECTVDAVTCRLTDSPRPVIGRPLGNLHAYVLDDELRPVPVDVPGELFLSGVQVARGYLGRPGLTSERFVACPFGTPGERMYRTGDRARWMADGVLEYLGRTDDQVKIRGFRIEPGEIEATLRRHPAVAEAVVVARQEESGRTRLVGYVVPAPGVVVDPAALRRSLGESLPDYMVPSAFVVLDQLPLTSSGKVDRRALPAPDFAAAAGDGYVEPRTETERVLAGIWADVLGIERVGVEDNFFELGGDSILSIQMVSRARQAGSGLMPRDVFVHQTVAALAASVGEVTSGAVPEMADQGPVVGEVPLTPIQWWFFETQTVRPERFDQSLMVELVEGVDVVALRAALQALLAH
ncbi:amino acid adenylation domain-containing protein, partial [Planosporangium thailandense]